MPPPVISFLTSIPVAGPIAKWLKAAQHGLSGDTDKAKSLFQFDIADLNPVRSVAQMIRYGYAMVQDMAKGIWFGTRTLSGSPIGFSLSPGYYAYHMAIMINGVLYHIVDANKESGRAIKIEITTCPRVKDTFDWKCFRKEYNGKSDEELNTYAEQIANEYGYFVLPDREKRNCQTFALQMYIFATGEKLKTTDLVFLFGTVLA